MSDPRKRSSLWFLVPVVAIMLAASIWKVAFQIPVPAYKVNMAKQPLSTPVKNQQEPPKEAANPIATQADTNSITANAPAADSNTARSSTQNAPAANMATTNSRAVEVNAPSNTTAPKMVLADVIKNRYTWDTAYTSWYGKAASDFTVSDLAGQQHKLSDYRGKNVLLIFWATWCGPCRNEIPQLIELRKLVDSNKLVILAISNERPALLEKIAAQKKINYTVCSSNESGLPAPFNMVNSIPCGFFINRDGTIKLATVGQLSLGEMKAILEAE